MLPDIAGSAGDCYPRAAPGAHGTVPVCLAWWRGGMPMAMSAQQRLDILVSFAKGFNAKQTREAMVLDARMIHGF